MTEPKGPKKLKENKDFDVEYFMQVDHKFVNRVDDIIKSLELSNFKVIPDKKNQL